MLIGTRRRTERMLTEQQVDQFIEEGFVRIDNAFPRAIADACLPALWKATGCDANDPASWTRPVVRVWAGDISFREAANTPVLHDAFDKLVGPGRWMPRPDVGVFVVRFPSRADPGDLGWHVDLSFPPETGERGGGDYSDWRVNVTSRDRALLMLFLFSDVGEDDAPTRIRVGSHRDMPRLLLPFGEGGAPQLLLTETGAAAHRVSHGRSRNSVSVSSVPDPCGPAASRAHAAIHVTTSPDTGNASLSGTRRRSLFSGRESHPSRVGEILNCAPFKDNASASVFRSSRLVGLSLPARPRRSIP
jgi:hypothetical protein